MSFSLMLVKAIAFAFIVMVAVGIVWDLGRVEVDIWRMFLGWAMINYGAYLAYGDME